MFKSQRKRHISEKNSNCRDQVDIQHEFPFRLSFYDKSPKFVISIEEFEEWALDRLRGVFRSKAKDYEISLNQIINKYLPLSSNYVQNRKAKAIFEERKKDVYSHFILRLAFCRTEELRKRFIKAETALFKLRFLSEDLSERDDFIDSFNFEWEIVQQSHKTEILEKLKACNKNAAAEEYFKVDFEQVCDLVSTRKVYLEDGKAYIPKSEQLSLILTQFRQMLEAALEKTARALPRLDEEDRLVPILNHLALGFVTPDFTSDIVIDANIRAIQIESLASKFPLCMRNLYTNLRRDHHLKHFGRLQFGLFLKGIGLSIEEALKFWRKNFINCSDERFDKEYRYYIRHSYGLEGNRKNYKPFSCQQIISGPQPGPGDCHGCPYRHFKKDILLNSLKQMGLTSQKQLNDVMNAVENKFYHVACSDVFEITNSTNLKETITHPNQYFELALKLKDV